jgi:hypothetical protein
LDVLFFLLGVKFEAALEDGEGDSESLLKESTSAWSSHLPTQPNASSDEMASDFGAATWLLTVGGDEAVLISCALSNADQDPNYCREPRVRKVP